LRARETRWQLWPPSAFDRVDPPLQA
jgi:hypothetical protein